MLNNVPETSPSQPEEPETKNPWYDRVPEWIMIAMIVLLILLLTIGAWWIYNIQSKGPRLSSSASSTFVTKEEEPVEQSFVQQSSVNPTADWKSYTSQKCGYQIKYPPSWYIFTDAEKEDGGVILISSRQIEAETTSKNELRLQVACSDVDSSTTITGIVNSLNSRYESKNAVLQQPQQFLINGKIVFGQRVFFSANDPVQEYYVFPTNNRVLVLNFTPADSDYVDTISLMLSSLAWR